MLNSVLALCCVVPVVADAAPVLGIIGSGVAGSSAAHFVREALGDAVEIIVWERNDVVGGRARSVGVGTGRGGATTAVDGGATAISSLNEYLVNITTEAKLARRGGAGPDYLGIWDGSAFRFLSKEDPLPLGARLVARYGLAPAKVLPILRECVGNLSKIYALQRGGATFETPRAMLEALGLYDLTQVSAYDFFAAAGVPARFVDEFVDGASRDNYNQAGTMNAFADLVSLAGAALDGDVFELANGTVQIPDYLLAQSRADVRLGANVAEVRRLEGATGGYAVQVDGGEEATRVDALIVATPLEFTDVALPCDVLRSRPYEENYVAFAAGVLDEAVFGARSKDLDAVLTVETEDVPFSCIGAHGRFDGNTVYKFMSRARLTDAAIDTFFSERASDVARVDWNATGAYAKLAPTPGDEWPPFVLAPDGLFYANMESPVSCMETEIIAAKNAALLAAARLREASENYY